MGVPVERGVIEHRTVSTHAGVVGKRAVVKFGMAAQDGQSMLNPFVKLLGHGEAHARSCVEAVGLGRASHPLKPRLVALGQACGGQEEGGAKGEAWFGPTREETWNQHERGLSLPLRDLAEERLRWVAQGQICQHASHGGADGDAHALDLTPACRPGFRVLTSGSAETSMPSCPVHRWATWEGVMTTTFFPGPMRSGDRPPRRRHGNPIGVHRQSADVPRFHGRTHSRGRGGPCGPASVRA